MKRNVISLLLALVLVFAVTVALAPTAEAADAHTHCYCVNASATPEGHSCVETQDWTAIQAGGSALTSGNYYLSSYKAGAIVIADGANVYLCLNGVRIQSNQPFQFAGANSSITICDCSEDMAGYVRFSTIGATGANINLADATNSATLMSGHLTTVCNGDGTSTRNAVKISAGNFYMYGGKIRDRGMAAKNSMVAMTGGTFHMYGGEISASSQSNSEALVKMSGGTFDMHNGTITGGKNVSSGGGNVYISGGVFNMHAGTIENGTSSTNNGGNVYLYGDSTFNMYGGTIQNGTAGVAASEGVAAVDKKGGNVLVLNNSTTATTGPVFNMEGGFIIGGYAANGSGVYVQAKDATHPAKLIVKDGSITGNIVRVDSTAGGNVTVSGDTKIDALHMYGTVNLLTIDNLDKSARIGFKRADPVGQPVIAENVASDVSDCFTSNNNGYIVAYENGTLKLVEAHIHCWCVGAETAPEGHANCTNTVTWVDHAGYFSSNKLNFAADAQYVYLSGNMVGSLSFENAGNTTEFFLCLNGYRLRGATPITVPAGITLTVCDCGSNGRVMSSNQDQSANIVTVNGTMKWVSGTLQGLDEGNEKTNRCAIINDGATFELYGGVIENGSRGNMQGGNVFVQKGGTFKMYDGIVRNGEAGTANGGNISVAAGGSLQITGGEIADGSAANGGNIYLGRNSDVTNYPISISNCEITGGTATANGENIRVDGATVTLTNVTVTAAASEATGDYNISVGNANSVFTLNDGKITGAYEAIRFGAGTSFTLDGDVEISSTGRELYLAMDKNVTLGASLSNLGTNKIRATKVNLATDGWEETGVTFGTGAKAEYEDIFAGGANGNACIVFNPKTNTLDFVGSTAQIKGSTIGYASLAEVLAMNPTTSIQLNKDINEEGLTLNSNVYINLNGFNITEEIDHAGFALNIYDSTNKDYVGTPGYYVGTNATEFFTVNKEVSGADTLRRYLNIKNADGTYSPRRVYLSVTAVSINPGQMRLNYKSMFIGDAAVKAYVEQKGYEYGLKFQVDENTPFYTNYDNGFTAYTDKKPDSYTQKLTGVQISEEAHTGYGVKATAYIAKEVEGELVEIATSATTKAYSFKGLVLSADQSSDVDDNAKTALYNMYLANDYVKSWPLTNIPNKWGTITE